MTTSTIESPFSISLLEGLGKLCTYPEADFRNTVQELLAAWPDIKHAHRQYLAHFYKDTVHRSLSEIEQCYTATFDLNPRCVPYISVYLFGQESFKRAELMVGLLEQYERIGLETGRELPDHVGYVLQAMPRLAPEEQQELVDYCLRTPLRHMDRALAESANPYSHLIALAHNSIDSLFPREVCHV